MSKTSKHTDPAHYAEHGWCRCLCSICGIPPQTDVSLPVPLKENAA